MDELLKAFLLLNSVGADVRTWKKFKVLNTETSAIWKDSHRLASSVLSENAVNHLIDKEKNNWAEKEYEACMNKSIRLVCYGMPDYPEALNELEAPPLVLYWRGNSVSISDRTVGVVGTRRATAYGRRISYGIGSRCAAHGTAVISGGAAGIDGESHAGACDAGGETFAVFGTGVDVFFPTSHKELFERICNNGALISEFPLGSVGESWHFPRRNRIVSALSQKLIVVEAPLKSGAMITAKISLELGREVWAVPGRITESSSEGTNRLIFDGAYPLISFDTFFGVHGSQQSLFSKTQSSLTDEAPFTKDELAVLSVLRRENDMTVDNIVLAVKMGAADVLKIIAVLSARGAVCSSGPGRFSINI